MEVFESNNNIVLLKGESALFCDRSNGSLQVCQASNLCKEWNPICLGSVDALIGKLRLHPDGIWYLLCVRNSDSVGRLPDNSEVFKIRRIVFLPLSLETNQPIDIELCQRHHFGIKNNDKITYSTQEGGKVFLKVMQNTFKTYASKPRKREHREREKFENRMQEEMIRLFQEDGGFYFSLDGDITNSQQIQHGSDYSSKLSAGVPLWERVDQQYFWNKDLLTDLLKAFNGGFCSTDNVRPFITPVMQGYFEISKNLILSATDDDIWSLSADVNSDASLTSSVTSTKEEGSEKSLHLRRSICLWLISRRCKFQSGVRYRRRGVNQTGYVANFVETEQILRIFTETTPHIISFVQIRGSVPCYWSQSGIKYKPPIRLDKSEKENVEAFALHMNQIIEKYGRITNVSLVNTGPERSEKKISDAFLKYTMHFNSSNVTHVLYDFHDYCSGTNFDNLSILLDGVGDILKDMRYCWTDNRGIISSQVGAFRVNCLDCLDRTNVVQALFAVFVLEIQLRKLGLLSPEENLPMTFHKYLANMWGNNGDAISIQYAGTIAMKGDFTRTRERTATGLMRDGISSMNRYYLRFREISKQAGVDLVIQNSHSLELDIMQKGSDDTSLLFKEKEENIKLFIKECKSLCLQKDEQNIAECILIGSDERERESRDMNTVVLITTKNYYIIRTDQIMATKIPIHACEKIEIGLQPTVFRSRGFCLRLFYRVEKHQMSSTPSVPTSAAAAAAAVDSNALLFLTFRQPNLRLFNNILLPIRDEDDSLESLNAVAASFVAAALSQNFNLQLVRREGKLDRLRFRPVPPEYVLASVTTEKVYACLPEMSANRRPGARKPPGSAASTGSDSVKEESLPNHDRALENKTNTHAASGGFSWQGIPGTIFNKDRLRSMRIWPTEIGSKLGFRNSTPVSSNPPILPVGNSKQSNSVPLEVPAHESSPPSQAQEVVISESEDEFIHQVVECDQDNASEDETFSDGGLDTCNNLTPSLLNGGAPDMEEEEEEDSTERKVTFKSDDGNSHRSRGPLSSASNSKDNEADADSKRHFSDSECDPSSDLHSGRHNRRVTSPPHLALHGTSSRAQTLAGIISVQMRCQRLSRKLSQDMQDMTSSNELTPTCPKSQDTIAEEETMRQLTDIEALDTLPTVGSTKPGKVFFKQNSMKLSFSETALYRHAMGTTNASGALLTSCGMDAAPTQSWSAIIRMPDISIPNERLVSRLETKRINQILEIENLRKTILSSEESKTTLIVF